jgi:hypothetical protein
MGKIQLFNSIFLKVFLEYIFKEKINLPRLLTHQYVSLNKIQKKNRFYSHFLLHLKWAPCGKNEMASTQITCFRAVVLSLNTSGSLYE